MFPSNVAPLNFLFSYAYLRKSPTFTKYVDAVARSCRVLIDSGAFTDHMVGKAKALTGAAYAPITLDEYADWIQPRQSALWGWITLDKIRDPLQSQQNLDRLVRRGFRPIPVLVIGEDPEKARELIEIDQARRVCVAGAVDGSAHYVHQRLWRIAEATGGRAMPHALGYFGFPDVFGLPVHSYDASTIVNGERFGNFILADDRSGAFTQIASKKVRQGKAPAEVYAWLRRCGVSQAMLHNDNEWKGHLGVTSTLAYIGALIAHHRSTLQGRRLFMVIGTVHQMLHLVAMIEVTKGRPMTTATSVHALRAAYERLRKLHVENADAGAEEAARILSLYTSDDGYPASATFESFGRAA